MERIMPVGMHSIRPSGFCTFAVRTSNITSSTACGAYSIASHTHAGAPDSVPSRFASAKVPRVSRAEAVEEFFQYSLKISRHSRRPAGLKYQSEKFWYRCAS